MGATSDRDSIGRREAVRLLAGGAGVALLITDLPRAVAAILPPGTCGRDLIRTLVGAPDCAAMLAARLEQCCGGPAGVEKAFATELAALRCHAASADSPRRLATDLQQAVRDDFAAARVFLLDGWLLSRTELALYFEAAGSLSQRRGSAST